MKKIILLITLSLLFSGCLSGRKSYTNPVHVDAIDVSNNNVKLWWKDDSDYLVMRSSDLVNWEVAPVKLYGCLIQPDTKSEAMGNTNRNNCVFFRVFKSKK